MVGGRRFPPFHSRPILNSIDACIVFQSDGFPNPQVDKMPETNSAC